MRSQHYYPPRSTTLRAWHADQRQQRQQKRWVPYSLRLKGGVILRIVPQILFSAIVAAAICANAHYTGASMHSPILFPVFGFVVGLAITFRMQSSYSRWWEGRTEWDKLTAHSRSFARTVWVHVPLPSPISPVYQEQLHDKKIAIRCIHILAVALKHHLRGERHWVECADLKDLLEILPDYNYAATNHPLTMTLYLSRYVERVRTRTKIDTQVLTHLLTHVDNLTSSISACERLLRTPIPLGYNICISRILWVFIFALPGQLWRELRWWTVGVTVVVSYALFALAEVGLEIENPWGEGPNNLDLDRYCNLLALDLEEITELPHMLSDSKMGSNSSLMDLATVLEEERSANAAHVEEVV